MPSSAHDPAGEPREPHGEETEDLPAAGQHGHGAASEPTTGHDAAAQDAPTSRHGALPTDDTAHDGGQPTSDDVRDAAATPGSPDGAQPYTYSPPAALATMTPRHWWAPAVAGVAGYVGMVLGTVLAMLLTLLGAVIAGGSDGSLSDQVDSQIGNFTGETPDISGVAWFLSAPFQLAAMAALVPLRVVMNYGDEGGTAGITVPQYSALACGIAAAWFVARKLSGGLRVETRAVQWLMAAVGGVAWGALALIVTAVTILRMDLSVFYTNLQIRITAMSPALFAVLFVVGLLSIAAALNVRSTQSAPGRLVIGAERSMPGVLQVLRPIVVQLCVFGSVAGLGLLIFAFVEGGAVAGFSALFWLPVAVGWFFVLSLLSALTTGGAAVSYTDLSGSSHAFYLWTEGTVPGWTVALFILLALVSVVCAAVAWAHVRPMDHRVARNPLAWAVLPLAYFLLGILLMWLLNVSGYAAEAGSSTQAAGFSLRPAGWTCLVFLLWGAVIELLARFVVPTFVRSLPAGVTRVLRGSERARGRAAVVASAAAMGGAAAAGGTAAASGVGTAAAAPASATQGATSSYAAYPTEDTVSAQRGDAAGMAPGEQTRVLPSYDDAARPGAAAQPERTPMDPAKKKRVRLIAIIVGVVVVLAIAAAITFSVLSRTVFGPSHQAEDLLQSVTDGNASQVTDIADPNVSNGQRALLTKDVYSAAENRISSFDIKDTTIHGNQATVQADVTQDGVTTPVTLPMVSDSRNGLFKTWRVDDSSGISLYQDMEVEVPAGVSELTVNDQKVAVDSQDSPHSVTYTVLPGDYKVAVGSTSKYVTYGGDQVAEIRAGSDSSAPSMSFSQSSTDALDKDVAKQLNAKIDQCAKSTEFDPDGCPFGYSIFGNSKDYRNAKWTVKSYPTYSVSSSSDKPYFSTDKSGEVRLDYQHNEEWDDDEPADWSVEDTTTRIYGSGTVTISGDTLSVSWND